MPKSSLINWPNFSPSQSQAWLLSQNQSFVRTSIQVGKISSQPAKAYAKVAES